MKLITDARAELNRLWTTKLAVIGMLIAAADQALTAFQMFIPPYVYFLLMGGVIVVRMIIQRNAPANP